MGACEGVLMSKHADPLSSGRFGCVAVNARITEPLEHRLGTLQIIYKMASDMVLQYVVLSRGQEVNW